MWGRSLMVACLAGAGCVVTIAQSPGYPGFSDRSVYSVSGASTIRDQETAVRFTVSGHDYVLRGATVVAEHIRGANTFTFLVTDEAGGLPGATRDTASAVTIPKPRAEVSCTFANRVRLLAGHTYWLVAVPGAADAFADWHDNGARGAGDVAMRKASGGPWNAIHGRSPVFRVWGWRR